MGCKSHYKIYTGSSHPMFSERIAQYLCTTLDDLILDTFPDGEAWAQAVEDVTNNDVFIVQSMAHKPDVFLMQLLIIVDALRRASARTITAVVPYLGYCRQDRSNRGQEPITARLVASMLEKAGITRMITMDLHTEQVEGFFEVPVENINATATLFDALEISATDDFVIVAADSSAMKRAQHLAEKKGLNIAVVDKRRRNDVEAVAVLGDINGKNVVIIDDICSTATTLTQAADACIAAGAREVYGIVTHGIFAEGAIEKIEKSPMVRLIVSDTIAGVERNSTVIKKVSVAKLFGEVIKKIVTI